MEPTRLLCVVGMSPAIVTETVWALCRDEARDVRIVEVVMVTTSEGEKKCWEVGRQLAQLVEDWPELAARLDGVLASVVVVRDAQGAPLADVRDEADNRQVVLWLQQLVEEYTQPGEPCLHASLAGGRKTMGHYLGSLMSLFARQGDGVSHVLVGQGWAERAAKPSFWYPLPPEAAAERRALHDRDGVFLGWADEVAVELCEIPLLRLRSLVVDNSYGSSLGQYRFEELLAQAQRRVDGAPLRVRVVRGAWDIFIDDDEEPLTLTPTAHIVLARALVLHHEGRGLPLRALELCANEGGEVLEQMRQDRQNKRRLGGAWSSKNKLFEVGRLDVISSRNELGKARTAIRQGCCT